MKKKRGRPRKQPVPEHPTAGDAATAGRKRGRPRKNDKERKENVLEDDDIIAIEKVEEDLEQVRCFPCTKSFCALVFFARSETDVFQPNLQQEAPPIAAKGRRAVKGIRRETQEDDWLTTQELMPKPTKRRKTEEEIELVDDEDRLPEDDDIPCEVRSFT